MELKNIRWNKQSAQEFQTYLKSLERKEKVDWTRRIINTKMPLLAIPTPELRKMANEISKGDFVSFLDLQLNEFYENYAINGFLLTHLTDMPELGTRLKAYTEKVDNWALCDILKFKVTNKTVDKFYALSLELLNSTFTFSRRMGIILWFEMIKFQTDLDKIFDIIPTLKGEQEYYVNMALAWFIAECFIKARDKTLDLLSSKVLNQFVTNKAISKCRDSFRVSKIDKEMLLTLRI